jgi:Coenzyme PQQ synthesis protein D (PqqD)
MSSPSPEASPDAIDDGFVALRRDAVHTVEIDGEAVLLNEGRLHLLNATGALVWACFDGEGTIAEIAADISEGLGVPYDTVLDDTLAVARELGEEGLLASVRPTAADAVPDAAPENGAIPEPDSKWADDPRFIDQPPDP